MGDNPSGETKNRVKTEKGWMQSPVAHMAKDSIMQDIYLLS